MPEKYSRFYVRTKIVGSITSEPVTSANQLFLLGEEIEEESLEPDEEKSEGLTYFLTSIGGDDPPAPEPSPRFRGKVCESAYYVGIRLSDLLYSDQKVRKTLGLFLKEEIPAKEKFVSKKFIRNFNDAVSLGAFNSFYISFEALDETNVYVPWGVKHRTYIVYDALKDFDKVANNLYDTTFQIGSSSAPYKVMPDSLQERRSRKSTIRF